jgi:hypothetical protein
LILPVEFVWKHEVVLPEHPNGMLFEVLMSKGDDGKWTVFSVGGEFAQEMKSLQPSGLQPGYKTRSKYCTQQENRTGNMLMIVG